MKALSKIASGIAPSATLAIDSLAKQMRADGVDVIGFGAGEPDFATPEHIKQAGVDSITKNLTRYTPASGIPALKKAICADLERCGDHYEPSQICISSGAKHCIFLALQAVLDPGDEVVLPAPYWVSYAEAVRMTGAVPVIVETHECDGFKMTPAAFRAAITPKTKLLILCNPSNPTGMLYSRAELLALGEVVVENDLYVLCDEIYCELIYKGEFVSLPSLSQELKERTILINGVSKTFAMTGWRIGYIAAPTPVVKAISNYASHSTGNPSNPAQYAALAAYEGSREPALEMKRAFAERRSYFLARVAKMNGVSCLEPDGAFYIFMNIKPLLGRTFAGVQVNTSAEFAKVLLEKALVAVVPGHAFGAEGYLRWSYATSMENIINGLDRFERFITE